MKPATSTSGPRSDRRTSPQHASSVRSATSSSAANRMPRAGSTTTGARSVLLSWRHRFDKGSCRSTCRLHPSRHRLVARKRNRLRDAQGGLRRCARHGRRRPAHRSPNGTARTWSASNSGPFDASVSVRLAERATCQKALYSRAIFRRESQAVRCYLAVVGVAVWRLM